MNSDKWPLARLNEIANFDPVVAQTMANALAGIIWYQGENNQHDYPPGNYTLLNSALIKGWRTKFNDPSLPFYYTQLTPFAEDYYQTKPLGGDLTSDYLAKFREAH